jgi:hypothetical protein
MRFGWSALFGFHLIFEQRLDLSQVSRLGRVMNFVAEGGSASSQRDQRDDGEVRYREMRKLIKERAYCHA